MNYEVIFGVLKMKCFPTGIIFSFAWMVYALFNVDVNIKYQILYSIILAFGYDFNVFMSKNRIYIFRNIYLLVITGLLLIDFFHLNIQIFFLGLLFIFTILLAIDLYIHFDDIDKK